MPMSSDAQDDVADDSWSEASEGEQQAWLRSALIECDTKPIEVDPRYEIPIEPIDFTAEISNCKTSSFDVHKSPIGRNPGHPTHCSVSASLPNFNFKMLGQEKPAEVHKSRTYPRRRSAETQKAKKKHSVPGFMRDTEAWSKRRSISSSISEEKAISVPSVPKRPNFTSILSKSVCGLPSKGKPKVSQSELPFKTNKPRSRSPLGSEDRPSCLKRKHSSKQPLTKRSIHFPILRDPSPFGSDDDEQLMRSIIIKDSSKHWDQILTESVQWPKKAEKMPLRNRNRILCDITRQQKANCLSVDNFSSQNAQTSESIQGMDALDSDGELGDDTCLMGLYNDEESLEDPHPRMMTEKIHASSEVEQLRKALSDVSLMYQDQVQSLKRQLFSTLEQFEYDRKEIAFLKRKLAESCSTEQARGR